jgi:DNA-binding transcriptional MerR regulator
MTKQQLVEAFEAGDFGDVEFTELALEAGMSIEEIGKVLEDNEGVF